MNNKISRFVSDLGIGAYLLMHGHRLTGKKGRSIYFECDKQESEDIDHLILEYQPPNEFYLFDSCLMYLKKIESIGPSNIDSLGYKVVSDLGIASYLMLREHRPKRLGIKVVGRKGKLVYFDVPEEAVKEFDELTFQYLPSQFHTYDSCLMSLKKAKDHLPD